LQLTRRQEEFIHGLLDLYSELRGPIHYSTLAQRVNVSPFTAYDMLRLLEERGYVRSEYYLKENKRHPGRSTIVFVPTKKAQRVLAEISDGIPEGDWHRIQEVLLERVRSGRVQDHDLVEEVLARVPHSESTVVRYCTEVATVLVLRVWRSGRLPKVRSYLEGLVSGNVAATRERLLLLIGFSVGVIAGQAGDDPSRVEEVSNHAQCYLSYVNDMDDDTWRELAMNLQGVLSPLLARA